VRRAGESDQRQLQVMHASEIGITMPIGETIEPIVTIADGDRTWTLALAFDRALLVENDCCRLIGEPRVFPTALAALDSLAPSQRVALGLDDTHYAPLRELDAAREALAIGTVGAACEHVRRCMRDLPAVFDAPPAGEWELRRPVLSTPAQLARFADRVLADFARAPGEALGRLHQLARFIGVVPADDSARRAAFASATAPAITLPVEIAHPVERDRRIREVPLIAQDERPDRVFPPRDRYAGPTTVVDPLTALYEALMFECQRIVHVTRLDEVHDDEVASLQHIVDELAAVAQAPPEVADAWEHTSVRHTRVPLTHRGASDGQEPPPAVLWLDADTIATTRGDVLVTLSLATGAVIREYPLGFATVQCCDDSGRFVLAGAEPETYGGFGIGCLDLVTGAWLDELPAHIPPVTFGYDDTGASTLYAHHREARARNTALCFARGNTSALLSSRNDTIAGHGICATSTLLSEVSFAPLDAVTRRPAPIVGGRGGDIDALMQERTMLRAHLPWPAAIARAGERWRFLLPSLHVGDVERTYFRLGFPIDCACFSPDGRRLLVRADELVVIELPSGAISARVSVPS
jgi:hypothetical protein